MSNQSESTDDAARAIAPAYPLDLTTPARFAALLDALSRSEEDETGRSTDRQTGRSTGGQTGRQSDRSIGGHTGDRNRELCAP